MQSKCKNQYSEGSMVQFYLTHRQDPDQVLPLWARVDLGAVTIKGYSAFPKDPALLEPRHQIVQCHIQDTRWGFLPLCRGAVGVFYSPSRLGNTMFRKKKPAQDKKDVLAQIFLWHVNSSRIILCQEVNYINLCINIYLVFCFGFFFVFFLYSLSFLFWFCWCTVQSNMTHF